MFAGVSGGADSIALAEALYEAGYTPVILHANFSLRGSESDSDETFVRDYCRKRGLECRVRRFNTAEYAASTGTSIEMAARELRYNWFAEECGADGIIFIAHNADDVAETVLLNMCRGTGIRGLCGIRPVNGSIYRPFLDLRHSELTDYLQRKSLPHREDSTNAENKVKRNKIRNSIIPMLRELNPSITETLCENAKRLYGTSLLFTEYTESLRDKIFADADEYCSIRIDTERICSSASPETLVFELFRPYGFNENQAAELIELFRKPIPGKRIVSPGFRIMFERDGVYLLKSYEQPDTLTITENDLFRTYEFCGRKISFDIVENSRGLKIKEAVDSAFMDYGKIRFPLTVRTWREGDRMKPFGMHGQSKLLSDIFSDMKIGIRIREYTAIVCDEAGIAWIAGIRMDERFRITDKTEKILTIKVEPVS